MTRRLALAFLLCGACGGGAAEVRSSPGRALSPPVVFEFGTTQGEFFSSATTRGRVTAVLFVTTFDVASQLMARRLNEVVRRHAPRINAGAVALEAPNHAPLIEVFRQSLDLRYPVAMADTAGAMSEGPFGAVDSVPTLVVLDRSGRERSRRSGVMTHAEIIEALRAAEQ